jgi:hypothetical protein
MWMDGWTYEKDYADDYDQPTLNNRQFSKLVHIDSLQLQYGWPILSSSGR